MAERSTTPIRGGKRCIATTSTKAAISDPSGPSPALDDGAPDGLAVSTDGAVWVAVAGGGCVAVFEPGGSLRERIAVPMPMCTSVCFGGDDLTDLYIVTGSEGVEGDREGSVYRQRVGVQGLTVPLARVALNTAS